MFKNLLAAAAVTLAFVGAGSAATLTPGPGSNAIIVDESYVFATAIVPNSAGSLVFNLDVAALDAPILAEAVIGTVELSSDFVGLSVTLTNASGTTAIIPSVDTVDGSLYDLSTIFDSGDLSQTITLSWTGVTDARPNGRALIGMQIITSAPVPLPAGGLLLFSALGGVAALRRRKQAA